MRQYSRNSAESWSNNLVDLVRANQNFACCKVLSRRPAVQAADAKHRLYWWRKSSFDRFRLVLCTRARIFSRHHSKLIESGPTVAAFCRPNCDNSPGFRLGVPRRHRDLAGFLYCSRSRGLTAAEAVAGWPTKRSSSLSAFQQPARRLHQQRYASGYVALPWSVPVGTAVLYAKGVRKRGTSGFGEQHRP